MSKSKEDLWKRDAERLAKIVKQFAPNHIHLINHNDLVKRDQEENAHKEEV